MVPTLHSMVAPEKCDNRRRGCPSLESKQAGCKGSKHLQKLPYSCLGFPLPAALLHPWAPGCRGELMLHLQQAPGSRDAVTQCRLWAGRGIPHTTGVSR